MAVDDLANAAVPDPGDDGDPPARAGDPLGSIGLCLSGGGYRAMIYHLGALWRLNELAFLPRLARVSSVSGGSITAAWLGAAWSKLAFEDDVSPTFVDEVVGPVRRLANRTIDIWAVARGVLGRGSAGDAVADAYRRHLFGGRTLQDLPNSAAGEGPRFVINATNLQSGVLWRFSQPYMSDYRVGMVLEPKVDLAVAVAASSAFPPFLSPVELPLQGMRFAPRTHEDLHEPPYTVRAWLSDGGVYDNLGLQTVQGIDWKRRQPRFKTLLVSDGGGKMEPESGVAWDWLRQIVRVLSVIDNQVRARRKTELIASFGRREVEPDHHRGAYWGLRSTLSEYGAPDMLPCPPAQTLVLANVSTRLKRLDARTQERLINWGYASCDAAMRRYVVPAAPAPSRFPYPAAGIG